MILLAIAWYLACGCWCAYVYARCEPNWHMAQGLAPVVVPLWPLAFPMYMGIMLMDRIAAPGWYARGTARLVARIRREG